MERVAHDKGACHGSNLGLLPHEQQQALGERPQGHDRQAAQAQNNDGALQPGADGCIVLCSKRLRMGARSQSATPRVVQQVEPCLIGVHFASTRPALPRSAARPLAQGRAWPHSVEVAPASPAITL